MTRRARASQVIAVLLALTIWHLLSFTTVAQVGDIPTPWATFTALTAMALDGGSGFWPAIWDTVYSVFVAVGLAMCIGIPIGLLIGSSERATVSTRLLLDAVRTIPPIALIPLAMLLFGPNVEMAIALAFLGAIRALVIQAIYAAHEIDPTAHQAARCFRLTIRYRIVYLYAPSMALFVITGLRIAITVSLLVVVAAQLLGGAPGIGEAMSQALQLQRSAEVFAWVVTAGVLGVLFNAALMGLQRRVLWWHPAVRGSAT